MKLFRRSIELVVIRDIFNPQNNIETYTGYDVEQLLKQAFGGNGLSDSVRLYHGNLLDDVTPKTPQDVDKVMRLNGRIYAVVKPMGLSFLAVTLLSVAVSVAVAFLMPVPTMENQSANTPPSPNNALAARTNKQRLGGRIPDIFGTVWSVPDLIAPTYSVYIDNREVEMSYMCVGRGRFNVTEALDDTTPVNQVAGSGVYIYDPDDTLDDEPDFIFGNVFTPDEAALSRLAVKRYTSVNGQTLPPPDRYSVLTNVTFKHPNKVDFGSNVVSSPFKTGAEINLEQASDMASVNGVVDEFGSPVKYSLSGRYIIQSVSGKVVTLSSPELVNPEWQKLADNEDEAITPSMAASVESDTLWQGWFYTNSAEHEYAILNVVARNGLYNVTEGLYESLGIVFTVETEMVDANNNAISGTLEQTDHTLFGNKFKIYSGGGSGGLFRGVRFSGNSTRNKDDERAATAAGTFIATNSSMAVGKRMRMRVRRKSYRIDFGETQQASQEIKISDFYGVRQITAADTPKGVTTVYAKTRATEGALSLKERKLRLLVQRYVTDSTSGLPKLSNRADDILRHIATDPKIGNLQLTQVDIAQIKTEIDAQIAYFGTDKCSEFCGTFDDNNLSAEETMQIVAKAVFSQAKRQGNKIMLDFERKVPASVAVFNSHNILPDTFTAPQSLGIANDYDGVKIEYTDPIDDAIITMTYPNDAITNPHEDKLIGVRNKVQAHTHMMRMYNKDRHAYKSCEFVAGDESNIVVRTNRITVADQLRADVQQGSVDSIETIGGDIVLHTTDPVTIEQSGAYTMFIQTINNGVESIAVTVRDDYSVKLARLPSGEISGTDKAVQAVYQIVAETDDNRDAYLVAQKDPSDGMTNKLLCTNYDDRYYQNDSDFKDKAFYADFTNDRYVKDGVPCNFKDLFTFNRAGKAWLVKETGLQEYEADVPRLDDGLLIEQSATNLTAFSAAKYLAPEAVGTHAASLSSTVTFGAFEMVGVADSGYYYKNRGVAFSEPSVVSFYMPTDSGEHPVDFRSLSGNVVFGAPSHGLKRGSYTISDTSSNNNRYGILRTVTPDTGDNKLVGLFQEEIGRVTSLINTGATPVTRPADFVTNKITGTTVTGDWDSTLTLSIVAGKLVHSGYGRIRSLEIN